MLLEKLDVVFEEKRKAQRSFYLSPSNLGGCARLLFLEAVAAYEFKPSDTQLGIFSDGDLHEGETIRELEQAGFKLLAAQVPAFIRIPKSSPLVADLSEGCGVCGIKCSLPVLHGHIDAIFKDGERVVVLEHKAIGTNAFDKLVEEVEAIAEDKDLNPSHLYQDWRQYYTQIGLYLLAVQASGKGGETVVLDLKTKRPFNFAGNEVVGSLLFKNRNTSKRIENEVRYDPKEDKLVLGDFYLFPEKKRIPFRHEVKGFRQGILAKLEILEAAVKVWDLIGAEGAEEAIANPAWEDLTRNLPSDRRKCDYCEAKSVCSFLFESDFKVEKKEGKIVYDESSASESERELAELHRRYVAVQTKLNILSKEKKDLAQRMMELLDGRTYVFPDTERQVSISGGWQTEELDIKAVPEEEQEALKKELSSRYPGIVKVKTTPPFVSVRKVSVQKLLKNRRKRSSGLEP